MAIRVKYFFNFFSYYLGRLKFFFTFFKNKFDSDVKILHTELGIHSGKIEKIGYKKYGMDPYIYIFNQKQNWKI
jgi:hypothetical protein